MSETPATYRGSCFCGAVEITVTGESVSSGYCHCRSCRRWHGAPINAWGLWSDSDVALTGEVIAFDIAGGTGTSNRLACARCGGAVANRKQRIGMTVVYWMTLVESGIVFRPRSHIHYGERVLDVRDDLPKFVDLPKPLGGSGERVEEPAQGGVRSSEA